MTHGSLFNGIGGFQLAAHWMGWQNIFHCEIDKFCNQVVKRHFPESICYEDIKQADFTKWYGAIDILTGGFPCQPYSSAGKRKGTSDDRHLWPEMLRAIGEIRPRWIVGENVRGLTNWSGGLVFDQVQADLEAKGYEVLPFLLPACGLNAPHRRDRIWFVAYSSNDFSINDLRNEGSFTQEISEERSYESFATTNSLKERFPNPEQIGKMGWFGYRFGNIGNSWEKFPTVSPICGRNDGFPNRVDRIKSIGNAIVPQIALEIFKAIEAFNSTVAGTR